MAERRQTAPEKPRESRIPTLTDVVNPGPDTPAARSRPAEPPPAAAPPIDPRTLEKLIYRQLSRRLPQLSRDLAADILAELGGKPDKSAGKE